MQNFAPDHLRPYGVATLAGMPVATSPEALSAAIDRARQKLETARTKPPLPAGADLKRTVLAAVLALFAALVPGLFLGGFISMGSSAWSGILITGMLVAAVLLSPVLAYLGSVPRKPRTTFEQYFRCLSRGAYDRARALLLNADCDSFPRFQPVVSGLGRPSGRPLSFDGPTYFRAYWSDLLRWRRPCYCHVSFKGLKVTQISPDLATVEGELKFTMNTSLWALLVLVICMLAWIVDLATRTTVVVPVRKLLVRVGNEWHIFNGELMGADEHDLSWISVPPAPE